MSGTDAQIGVFADSRGAGSTLGVFECRVGTTELACSDEIGNEDTNGAPVHWMRRRRGDGHERHRVKNDAKVQTRASRASGYERVGRSVE
jgi:hypothetical protein